MGSVILAATALASQSGAFSPQHVNNWTIEIHGLPGAMLEGSNPLSFALARAFLPTVGVDEGTIPFGNETVYYAGRARYEGGTVEFRDYVDRDIQGILATWFGLVYGGVQGNWGVVGVPSKYKRVADIIVAAPDGTSERSWRLQGVWPVQWSNGNLDMASSEMVMCSMALRYDRAQYMGGAGSVGSTLASVLSAATGGAF